MTKSLRKILLSVTAFLAVLFLGLTVAVSVPKTAKADDALVVTNIQQIHMETYNSNPGGQHGKYIITFNKAIFDDSVEIGADVSTREDFATMLSTVTVNGTLMNAHEGNAFSVFKHSNNAIIVKNSRCIMYAEFKFPAGLTLNGHAMAEESIWYENTDWSFDTTADDYMVKGVYEVPDGGQSHSAFICIFMNKADTPDGFANFNNILINDEPLCIDGTPNTNLFGESDWWNDWDAGTYNMQFRIKIRYDALDDGYAKITIKEGFTLGSYTTTADQTFVRPLPATVGATGYENTPVWVDAANTVSVESIQQNSFTGYDHTSSFTVKLDHEGDIFSGFAVGEDMTTALLGAGPGISTFFSGMKVNDVHLYNIHGTTTGRNVVTIIKSGVNAFDFNIKFALERPSFTFIPTMRIFGVRIGELATYYGNEDWTYTKLDTAPALKVVSVMPIATGDSATTGKVNIRVIFNIPSPKDGSNASNIHDLDNILINGHPYADSGATVLSANGENVVNCTSYNMSVPLAWMEDPVVVFTFTDDWDINGKNLAEDQIFYSTRNDFGNWSNLPRFTEAKAQTITYKQGETTIETDSAKLLTLAQPADIDNYQDGKTFIGWTDGDNLYKAGENLGIATEAKTFTAVEIDFEALGAQLRVAGPAGMRFGFAFDTAELSAYKEAGFIQGFGGLIARTATITELEYAVNDNILIIESTVNKVNGENTEFYVGITNMYAHNFNVSMSARGYLEVKYTNDAKVSYVYSEVLVKTASVGAQELLDAIDAGTLNDDIYTSPSAIAMLNAYVGK